MSEEGVEKPQLLGSEPVRGDSAQSNIEEIPEKEPAPSEDLKDIPSSTPVLLEDTPEDDKDGVKAAAGEPQVDWFEPLEDDDAVSADLQDPDEESLAGETESVAGSERASSKIRFIQGYRRKRAHRDEGWVDCPSLGEGWKRKEVVRRSGSSVGQKDIYYMSPLGHRVRSRVELATVFQGNLDLLSNFDFKTGMFHEGNATPFKVRQRAKKKVRERSSSESSWMERGEGADTPDSYHRLTPNIKQPEIQTSVSFNSSSGTSKPSYECQPVEEKIKLPPPSSSRLLPLPSVKGEFGTEDSILVCAKCGISFTGTWYDKQRKRPCCASCWGTGVHTSGTKLHMT